MKALRRWWRELRLFVLNSIFEYNYRKETLRLKNLPKKSYAHYYAQWWTPEKQAAMEEERKKHEVYREARAKFDAMSDDEVYGRTFKSNLLDVESLGDYLRRTRPYLFKTENEEPPK